MGETDWQEPRWLHYGEAPCGALHYAEGTDRVNWSCIVPLPGGPTTSPDGNELYSPAQLHAFDVQPEVVPQAGPEKGGGLLRQAIPQELQNTLLEEAETRLSSEGCAWLNIVDRTAFNQFNNAKGLEPCRVPIMNASLPSNALSEVIRRTHVLLEQWSGAPLAPDNQNVVFADQFLLYPEGSVVQPHVDRPDKHQISATLVVGVEGMRDGWPLEVALWDRKRQRYSGAVALFAQPGDLVAYQGARWEHSRPRPLRGQSFMVFIMHFRVVGWNISPI